jgi:transposase
MKRGYSQIKAVEKEIIEMRQGGKTRQEIADILGLSKVQIKNWINRHNQSQARLEAGLPARRRVRPRKNELSNEAEYKYEIKRLKMENELLRDFLRLAGRG